MIIIAVVIFLVIFIIVNNIRKINSLKFQNRELERQLQSTQNELDHAREVQALLEDELRNQLTREHGNDQTVDTASQEEIEAYNSESETVNVRIVNHDSTTNVSTESWQTLSAENQDVYFAVNESSQPFYIEFKTNASIALDSVVITGDDNWSYDTTLHQMELHREEAGKEVTVKLPGFGFIHVNVIQK